MQQLIKNACAEIGVKEIPGQAHSDGSRFYTLGRNQANMESFSGFDSAKVLRYRRVTTEAPFFLPKPTLKKGGKGSAVVQLQDALKIAGFDAGISYGFFGENTAEAIRMMQSQSGVLKIDGVFGSKTKNYLESLLQAYTLLTWQKIIHQAHLGLETSYLKAAG